MKPVGYKGASVSRSPGVALCTWVALGVLAQFRGSAPKKTHISQVPSVVFHPAKRQETPAVLGLQNQQRG